MKVSVSKSKNTTTYYLSKSVRIGCKTTTKTIEKIGTYEEIKEKCGDMDLEMVKEFFYAVSYSAGINLHFKVLSGSNNHHIVEAMFKAFAKALDSATMFDERIVGVLSTKETL